MFFFIFSQKTETPPLHLFDYLSFFLIGIFGIGQDPPHPLVKKWSKKFWSKMVRNGKKTQFLVKNGQKKYKNFLIRIFWISRGAPLFDWK